MASQFGFVSNDDFIEKMDELIDALPHSGATGEVTGVKGNAESAYRVGNVNLTPANIGLGNVNNTSDANKPISTATQAALNGKVNKSGDTMTGTLTHQASSIFFKATNLDLNGDNPSAFTWGNSEINFVDKDKQRVCFLNVGRRNTGGTQVSLTAQARNTADTNDVYNEFTIRVERDGTCSYLVAAPAAFRSAISAASKDQVNAALKQTGYNLLEITSSNQTINGVTFTVDKAAGTITANGTASGGNAIFYINPNFKITDGNNYIFSGATNGSESKYSMMCYGRNSSGTAVHPFSNIDGDTDLYFESGVIIIDTFIIIIRNGQTVSNVVFKPMIVPAELAGLPFQPYAKSNAELTSGKLDVTGMAYYKSYPEQFKARAQKGSIYYELELDTTVAGLAGLAHSSGSSIGLNGGTPILRNSGGDMLLFTPDGCISGQPANSYSRFALRNYSSGAYIGFLSGIPGVYTSGDTPMCTFTAGGIKMNGALISGRSGTPTLTTNTGTVYEFKDDGIYLNGTRIAP